MPLSLSASALKATSFKASTRDWKLFHNPYEGPLLHGEVPFNTGAHLCVPLFRGVAGFVEVGASQSKPFGVFISEVLKPYERQVRQRTKLCKLTEAATSRFVQLDKLSLNSCICMLLYHLFLKLCHLFRSSATKWKVKEFTLCLALRQIQKLCQNYVSAIWLG